MATGSTSCSPSQAGSFGTVFSFAGNTAMSQVDSTNGELQPIQPNVRAARLGQVHATANALAINARQLRSSAPVAFRSGAPNTALVPSRVTFASCLTTEARAAQLAVDINSLAFRPLLPPNEQPSTLLSSDLARVGGYFQSDAYAFAYTRKGC